MPILVTLPVLSAVILKTAPSRGSAMISLFMKRRKQKPREVISLAQSDTAGSGGTVILPRPSGCSSHPQNPQATYHVILVFCLLFPSPSPGASVSLHRCKCVSLFSLCRPEFESRLTGWHQWNALSLGLSFLLCKMVIFKDYLTGLSWGFHQIAQANTQ